MKITGEVVKMARMAAHLTTEEAGRLVHCTRSAWESWERGTRPLNMAAAELFMLKVTGEFWAKAPSHGGIVLVLGADGTTVIDAVGRSNFLGLYKKAVGEWIVKTLAVDRFGRVTPRSVAFTEVGNEHVLRACEAWDKQRSDEVAASADEQ